MSRFLTKQLFRALLLCKACDVLERIDICTVNPDGEGLSDEPLRAVRQFLCFPKLRALRLSVYHPIYLDNDLLLEAMSTWPHI